MIATKKILNYMYTVSNVNAKVMYIGLTKRPRLI